ncbi:MAG TPA: RNA methyltransferase [Bacteroidales bacterium]|nr:RNA methyltransferase [Bacteroidales bacterium]
MLSKTKIKWINSLERKKNRDAERVFVAEGLKIVSDLLPFMKCRLLVVTENIKTNKIVQYADEIVEIGQADYKKISSQKSPQGVLAVFEKPRFKVELDEITDKLILALDDIQDPGNLGTIIRLADWFDISDVFCSHHTADVFNPKTIQSTMGAIARVHVHYVDLAEFLEKMKTKMPIYGTFMDGKNIYTEKLSKNGIIVMGNEGNGISPEIEKIISDKITIPNFATDEVSSESLNVSVATAIVVAEFRRKFL